MKVAMKEAHLGKLLVVQMVGQKGFHLVAMMAEKWVV